MDDALGLLIGLAGGLLLALVLPRAATVSAAMSVQRQVIVTMTGGIGGVIGPGRWCCSTRGPRATA